MRKPRACQLNCNLSDSLHKVAIILCRRQIWTTHKNVNHTFCVDDLLQLILSQVCNYLVERNTNLPGKCNASVMTSFSLKFKNLEKKVPLTSVELVRINMSWIKSLHFHAMEHVSVPYFTRFLSSLRHLVVFKKLNNFSEKEHSFPETV